MYTYQNRCFTSFRKGDKVYNTKFTFMIESTLKYGDEEHENLWFKFLYSCLKTVEHLFTWCGHERYPIMIEINQS